MILLLACASPAPDSGDPATPAPTSGEVRVLTYNVHGLPSAITGDDTPARIAQIGPRLSDYDVVGLQEAWVEDEVWDVLDQTVTLPKVGEAHEPIDDEKVYGTGLVAYSTLAPVETAVGNYSACYGDFDNGSDCFASKGWLRARLALADGAEVDLVDTHLDAGNSQADDAARTIQVDELLAGVPGDRAVVLLGDFNLGWDDPEDAPLLAAIEAAGFRDACADVDCAEPDRIDHIYVRDGGGVSLAVQAWSVETAFVDDAGEPLSDHDAIAITLGWAR
jgi:endonuclease/exonuclease/phosphatase family metal-dependent hydrolase